MIILAVLVVLILASLGILVFLLTNAATNKRHASYVKQNTIEYVVAGEKRLRTLANVDGRILTKDGKLIKPLETGEEVYVGPVDRWLRNKWGFYWVSFFYPLRKIHKFKIIKERLKGSAEIKPDSKIADMIERDSEPSWVDHVRSQIPRPFAVEGVETKENFRLDLLVSGIFNVVDGTPLAFTYQERFYELLKGAIEGAVNDYVKGLSYQEFRGKNKGKKLEFSDEMVSRLKISLVEQLGLEPEDIWVERFNLISSDDEIEKATQANEVARLKGEALVKTAEFNLQAANLNADAEAAPVAKLITAYGGDTVAAAALVNMDRVSKNLGQGSSITTLVMGGNGAIPTLPLGGKP